MSDIENTQVNTIGLSNKSVFPKSPKFGTCEGVPCYSLYRDRIVLHTFNPNGAKKHNINEESIKNLEKAHTIGLMSTTIARKIRKISSLWYTAIMSKNNELVLKQTRDKKALLFLTLTLPSQQRHSDQQIKKHCFFRYIETLVNKYNVTHYIWRAEKQKNGNIHFHVIIDKYIDYKLIRKEWNSQLEVLDYISKFEEKHYHRNPNSTDIHIIRDAESAESYVSKYITKKEENQIIGGHVWGCSNGLRKLTPYSSLIDSYIAYEIERMRKEDLFIPYVDEYFSVLVMKNRQSVALNSELFRSQMLKTDKDNYIFLYEYQDNNLIGSSCDMDLNEIAYHKENPIQLTLFENIKETKIRKHFVD